MDALAELDSKIRGAVNAFMRYPFFYRQWFMLNADPLSDEIMSDIHEQANQYAMEKVCAI